MTTPSAIEQLIEKMAKASIEHAGKSIGWYEEDSEEIKSWYDDARVMLHAISASGTHAVVPVKATVAMITAAEDAQTIRYHAERCGRPKPHKEHEVIIWDAMLAAAPKVGE